MFTKLNDFLNENNSFEKGQLYYYSINSNNIIPVIIYDINQYSSGEYHSILVRNTDTGSVIELKPNQFKFLHIDKPIITNKNIRDEIYDYIGYMPKIYHTFKESGNFTMTFTEEVKDGRSPKFNTNIVNIIKNKILYNNDIKIKITDIKFDKVLEQPSDYNQYIDYIYTVSYTIL